jgi:hypothetical protein
MSRWSSRIPPGEIVRLTKEEYRQLGLEDADEFFGSSESVSVFLTEKDARFIEAFRKAKVN